MQLIFNRIMAQDILYTSISTAMWRDLKLRGYDKEIFACIYGFWKANGKVSTPVSYRTIHLITGAADKDIVASLKRLTEKKFITIDSKNKGRNSYYRISIPESIEIFPEKENKPYINNTKPSECNATKNNYGGDKFQKEGKSKNNINDPRYMPDEVS